MRVVRDAARAPNRRVGGDARVEACFVSWHAYA